MPFAHDGGVRARTIFPDVRKSTSASPARAHFVHSKPGPRGFRKANNTLLTYYRFTNAIPFYEGAHLMCLARHEEAKRFQRAHHEKQKKGTPITVYGLFGKRGDGCLSFKIV